MRASARAVRRVPSALVRSFVAAKPTMVNRLLWMTLYLQTHKEITYADARRHIGVSFRTYMRDIARLRSVGALLISEHAHRNGVGWVRYGGFDAALSELLGKRAA